MILALIEHFSTEGPREILIGLACGVGVTLALSALGHRHIVQRMKRHHAEVMAHHEQHAEHLLRLGKQIEKGGGA